MPVNLKKVPLFVGLQEHDLHALADKAVIKTFPKHATVINEGETTGSLYVVLSGKVKVLLGDESGKELILDIKGPGGYFGEMALDERPRSASVVTLEPSRRSLAMLNVYGRVSKLLLDLAVDQHGTLVISEKLTQQDMANRVGSSREMVSRIFRGLSLGGYIKVEGKKITINKTLPPRL